MAKKRVLSKRVLQYVQENGVRALDALAARPAAASPGRARSVSAAVRTLASHWKGMTLADKERFVERVTASVVEVVAASASLPLGRKIGLKAIKAASKAIRKQRKRAKEEAVAAGRASIVAAGVRPAATKKRKESTRAKASARRSPDRSKDPRREQPLQPKLSVIGREDVAAPLAELEADHPVDSQQGAGEA